MKHTLIIRYKNNTKFLFQGSTLFAALDAANLARQALKDGAEWVHIYDEDIKRLQYNAK